MTIGTAVFDAYGTLFDVNAAARRAAREPGFEALGDAWPALAADWRDRQLQYTWLRTIMGRHCDFWRVTQDGLDWALAAHGLDEDTNLRQRLLDLYWHLDAFSEVPAMLDRLQGMGIATAILSNGSPAMLASAAETAGLADRFDAILSVERVGRFKPDRQVYDLVGEWCGAAPAEVLFVSSNGWDAAGAADYGFRTAWVNRAGAPIERLNASPDWVLTDLTGIPDLLETA